MLCELRNKALSEARNAVIEAAKAWRETTKTEPHSPHNEALQMMELDSAVARLNELEARS
jgi:hypothetical protein